MQILKMSGFLILGSILCEILYITWVLVILGYPKLFRIIHNWKWKLRVQTFFNNLQQNTYITVDFLLSFDSIVHFWLSFLLNVSTSCLHHPPAPGIEVSTGSSDHVLVKVCNLQSNPGLQLLHGVRHGGEDLGLQEAPAEEVQGVEIRTSCWPVMALDAVHSEHFAPKLAIKIDQGLPGSVNTGPILLPGHALHHQKSLKNN